MPIVPQSQEVPQETLTPADKRLREIHAQIIAQRNAKPPVYVAPPLPPGIAEKTRLEIEEGRKRNAMAEEAKATRPQPKPDKTEGTTTPVFRPGDFVPNMQQGKQVSASYKVM